MTGEYATDADGEEEKESKPVPLKVEITNQPKEKEVKNPTSIDTEFIESYTPSDEEIKEMTDAQ